MDVNDLDYRAQALVDQLTSGLHDSNGKGFMSAAIYDTAWVSLVSKPVASERIWLFPECFRHLLAEQRPDGSWPSYASQIDGILNTGASLLSLVRHRKNPYQIDFAAAEDLSERIDRAKLALQSLLDTWDVAATIHVGFEILVPAMMEYLQAEGISLEFQGKETLLSINQQKLQKFRPEYLYGKVQLTALHSLEAFIGKIEFDRVAHHKVNGSFMASPSSTAAFMMNASTWNDDCEHFLRHVISYGAGQGTGGIPSAFPSTIFELTWAVSTLLEGGFDLAKIAPYHSAKVTTFLNKCFQQGKGTVGFAPGLQADADDSSKTILILNLLNHPTPADSLLHAFEADHYFKTYPLERDPSFSANCNVLIALLHVQDVTRYGPQIEKVARFLLAKWRDEEFGIRDKWNISPFYSLMLMTQGMQQLLEAFNNNLLPILSDDLISQVIGLLVDVARFIVQAPKTNGSWGSRDSKEETAYAIIALASSLGTHTSKEFEEYARSVISRGREFLLAPGPSKADHLWVEKVTYASDILLESYVLAALKIDPQTTADMALPKENGLHSTSTNGSNGHLHSSDNMPAAHDAGRSESSEAIPNGPGANGHRNRSKGIYVKSSHRHDSVNGHIAENDECIPISGSERPATSLSLPQWNAQKESILLGPFRYLEKQPGKDMRSQFIAAFNNWLQVPTERLAVIEKVVKMLHTASLLVDDIEDNSDLRRGVPVAHSIFGVPQTFNSGNYVYFLALQEIRKLDNPKAIDIYIEELVNLHRGQGLDLFWRDSLTCPSEEDYLEMVSYKTGGLFSLAIRLMQAESSIGRDLVPLVRLLGLQFQICDDYHNLMSTTYTKNKGLCEDLTEGKFSFPVMHSIRSDPTNRELINILKQKTRDVDVKKYAVHYMESTGSFEYSRNMVADLNTQALSLIEGYEAQGWNEGSGIRRLLAKLTLE